VTLLLLLSVPLRSDVAATLTFGHQNEQRVELPTVEVSLVTVDPTEVRLPVKADETVATATVQLFHLSLRSTEHVKLALGTLRTNPAGGATIDYDPPVQTVSLPPGPGGAVVAKIKLLKPQLHGVDKATLDLTATLMAPSTGIRTANNDPSASNHFATITVVGK
jgi:hypothetical protein